MLVPSPAQGAALRQLRILGTDDLPMLGADWLTQFDSPSLRALAGRHGTEGRLIDELSSAQFLPIPLRIPSSSSWFSGRIHITVRLICFRAGPLKGDLAGALEPLTKLGVYGEGVPKYGMLALDIEPAAALDQVASLLRHGSDAGWWGTTLWGLPVC